VDGKFGSNVRDFFVTITVQLDQIMSAKVHRLFLVSLLLSLCTESCALFGSATHEATQTGIAVYYSDNMEGRSVSLKGEKYDKNALTAATHKRYPLGSTVRVTNLSNNKSVRVKVNDRMNPKSRAVIDLSKKAAEEIDMVENGHVRVKIEMLQTK
jgi:rare lipoprotein A